MTGDQIKEQARRFLERQPEIRAKRRKYQATLYERELLNTGLAICDLETKIADLEASLFQHREKLATLRDEARAWQAALTAVESEQVVEGVDQPDAATP